MISAFQNFRFSEFPPACAELPARDAAGARILWLDWCDREALILAGTIAAMLDGRARNSGRVLQSALADITPGSSGHRSNPKFGMANS